MGKFGAENFDQSNMWREHCKFWFEHFDCDYKVKCINPNDYYNFKNGTPDIETQKKAMLFDLHKVRNSDLIIVNYNDKFSLGTMSEVAIAYEHRIPIIGLNEDGQELHSWQIQMTNEIFTNMDDMLDHIAWFYLR